ncbi:hypothetical protein OPS25_07310 [Alteromonas ponticola]|uniref:DUF4234 domain-containing protein n=1 Tax=Alteromonas aquimaris TaxID=2998417 RepID=A0ABT3P6A6_9ALTE|nr:hypothetical protein [Alteromonas aquimaris]MCW8108299.1 hypothetical protein [Alteromonas aquimaris]
MSLPKPVAPPRNLIWEYLLFFCTGGLYSMLWMRLIARDCHRICGKPNTPMVWLLVPLVAPVQPFMLPQLFDAIRQCEKHLSLRSWPASIDYLWMTVTFGGSLYFWFAYVFDSTIKADLVVFIGWITWLLLLHSRMNRIRRRKKHEPMMPRYAGYNVVEWATVALFLPILLTLFSWLFYFATNQSM